MIRENVQKILNALPAGVQLLVASKSRTTGQIQEAIDAGARVFGENYVKEAQGKIAVLGKTVQWHCIGHLQKNKAKLAARLFDTIETLDSLELAKLLDKECAALDKKIKVFIEINSGREAQKSGVYPDQLMDFIAALRGYSRLKVAGLMTMGPATTGAEEIRPYFKLTRELFLKVRNASVQLDEFRELSMGMSDSYTIAIEEGATMVRLGNSIFGSGR